MNRKIKMLLAIIGLTVGFGHAQIEEACENKKEALETKVESCKAIKKSGKNGFNKCLADFKKQKAKYKAACSETGIPGQIKAFTAVLKDCEKKDYKGGRCAVTVRNLGTLNYKLEAQDMISCEDRYERAYEKWTDRDKKGQEPAKCKRQYTKSLEFFNMFMEKFPSNKAYSSVLMQTSFIYMSQFKDDEAFKLWTELVDRNSNDPLAGQAYLRIGEHHYNNRKNSDAIAAYKKSLDAYGKAGVKARSREKALLLYHLAESYNNMGDFEEAARWFFTYITGADKGEYPSDLRQEALVFMAGAFADLDNGIDVAKEFLEKQGQVTFEDTLYFEIGEKNLTRDRLEEAAYSYKRLLEINPVFVDAPIAHVKLVTIQEEKQKFVEAQEDRKRVVKLYGTNSDWYQANKANPEAIKEAKNAIRGAYFQIPAFHHRNADKKDKEGDVEAAAEEYKLAVAAYDDFLREYASPNWDQYTVHAYKATVYDAIKDYKKQAEMYNWIADVDTLPFGRKNRTYIKTVSKADAAYNAVIAMDKYRETALVASKGDTIAAYNSEPTQAYFKQVEKYLGSYGSDPKNEDAAELAFNAALVHYDAKQFKTAVKVLRDLKRIYPTHKYIKLIRGNLARALTQADMLEDAEKEYEDLLKLYQPTDTMYVDIEQSIAAVQFQRAEKLMKNNQFEQAGNAYIALQQRFPKMVFSDKALFEGADAFNKAKKSEKAATTFLSLHKTYPASPLAIKGILKAADIYRESKKYKEAANTFLIVTNTYPKDSMAFKAIGFAASTFDSIPDNKKQAAQTFELAYAKYPTHAETPSYLYTACRTYEDGKLVEDAIRCNKIIITKFAKSSYAIDAGISIPKAYEAGEQWAEAAAAYKGFAKQFDAQDPGKLIASYYGAAKAYTKIDSVEQANGMWSKTIESFDSYGAKINADPGIPAEASFKLGEFESAKMDEMSVEGNAKAKAKDIAGLTKILQKSMELFGNSATYNSEKWTFKATNEMGNLFVTLAQKVRDQEIKGSEEEVFAERIGVVQTLPSFYEQSQPLFKKNIDVAREQGYYNKDVITAEDGYIEMFYRNGHTFEELALAFEEAPVPDISGLSDDIIIEELYNMGFEDSVIDNGDPKELWTEHYRNTLFEKAEAARQGATPKYETCIQAAEFYGIQNEWTTKCQTELGNINPDSPLATATWEKFDATNLFKDKEYFANKVRIEQIFANTVMSDAEKIAVFKEILEAGKGKQPTLDAEFKKLDLQLNPPLGPDGKPLPAGATAPAAAAQ